MFEERNLPTSGRAVLCAVLCAVLGAAAEKVYKFYSGDVQIVVARGAGLSAASRQGFLVCGGSQLAVSVT
jgi:hypothetical protein